MPGQAAHQATEALTSATMPYLLQMADEDLDAFRTNPGLAKGINTYKGSVTYKAVAEALDLPYKELSL